MLNGTKTVIKHKIGLLNLAQELGNVSKACRMMGLSRDTFYRYHKAVEVGGIVALVDQNRRKPNQKTEWMSKQKQQLWLTLLISLPMGRLGPATSFANVEFLFHPAVFAAYG